MIEAIMYFALGFLIAAAMALTTLPAVWNRAVRLTRRRIESLVPVSLAEIQADKDQVRAEYAMAMRRLEISAENLQWKTAEQAVEIGRQAVSVLSMKAELAKRLGEMQAELDHKLGEKDALIAELEAQGAELADTLAATEQKLAETEEALAARTGTLEDAEGRLQNQDQSLTGLGRRLEEATALAERRGAEIAKLIGEAAALTTRIAELERALATASAQSQREHDNAEALSRTLAELRLQAEQAARRLAELDGRMAGQARDNDGLVKRISVLEGELQARDARLRALDAALAEALSAAQRASQASGQEPSPDASGQTGTEAEPGAGPLTAAMEKLQGEKIALENALAQAREERAKLQRELDQARRLADSHHDAEHAENALLRERVTTVAAEIASLTAQLEGPGSPISALVAEPVWVNGAEPRRGAPPPASSLADRIRALQARASRA